MTVDNGAVSHSLDLVFPANACLGSSMLPAARVLFNKWMSPTLQSQS